MWTKNYYAILALLALYSISYSDGLAVMSLDLGSEYMKIAIVKPGVPMEIALNIESRRKTPIVVSLRDNERLFSDPAMNVAVKYPKNAYRYFHDLIGKTFDNPLVSVYKKRFPFYDIVKDERDSILFQHDSSTSFSVEELLGMVLNNSRNIAERFADQPIKDTIITVPPFFTQAERRAVIRSAEMVGLNVLQLMNDNTAAALNFGVFRYSSFNATEKIYMFYDMGATSTTATIVGYSTTKVKDRGIVENAPQLVVKGVGFDRSLGGREFDFRLRDHLVKLFMEKNKDLDPTSSPRALSKFLKEAKRVKQVLSANTETISQIEGVYQEKDFRAKVTRVEFEGMCEDLFARVADSVNQALDSSSVTLDEIESVLVIGGGFRVPKVQEILLKTVKKSELSKNINADEAAALGAVYQAARLSKGFRVKNFVVKDANVYPIEVTFDRALKNSQGEATGEHKKVKRTLFHRNNLVPQKKVMTFNKNTEDFNFAVSYGDLSFLTELQGSMVGSSRLLDVKVNGVAESFKKHSTDKTEKKGIKAYFKLDDGGLLHVEKIESVFEKAPEPLEEEQSTFAKLGSKISSFFTGSSEEEDSVVKENNQTEEAKPEDKEDQKKDGNTEAKSSEKEDKKSESESEKKDSDKEPNKQETEKLKDDEEEAKESDQGKKQEEKEEEKKEEEKKEEEKKDGEKKDKEKKDEEKKDEEKKEEKEEKKEGRKGKEEGKDEEKEKLNDNNKKADDEKKNTTNDKAAEPPKPVTIREILDVQTEIVDFAEMPAKTYETAVNRLKNLKARDEAKIANEQAKNYLESFLFETREKVSSEEGDEMLLEDEREKIDSVLTETSEWLDEDGWDTTADVYEEKLKKLKEACRDFYMRVTEQKHRPAALDNIRRSINLTNTFLKQVSEMKEKNEIFTEKDLEDVWKVLNETVEWLYTSEKKQNATKPTDNPVLLVKDIASRTGKLDREIMYLLNKAKYYVPKVKPTDTNTTANGTDSSGGNKTEGENTTKENEKKNETIGDQTAKTDDQQKAEEKSTEKNEAKQDGEKQKEIKTDKEGTDKENISKDTKDKSKDEHPEL